MSAHLYALSCDCAVLYQAFLKGVNKVQKCILGRQNHLPLYAMESILHKSTYFIVTTRGLKIVIVKHVWDSGLF